MNYEAIGARYPLAPETLKKYTRPRVEPPIDVTALNVSLLQGDQYKKLQAMPTTGTFGLAVHYRGYVGAVGGFEVIDRDCILRQLQGVHSRKGYRVASGVHWTDLVADEALAIVHVPESGLARLCSPPPFEIEGLVAAESEGALMRYQNFIARTALRWSGSEKLFVRDVGR